ncbi:MAG TPA: hypothetical protein VJ781_10675 [Pyrinomonadaceae bacterium]|nr:hypothetical protein [Pyrinomonadaceae bacterium]
MRIAVFFGLALVIFITSCGAPTGNTNLSAVNTNGNIANSISNSNLNAVSTSATSIDTREPDQYQATVKLALETLGNNAQRASMPTIGANVARSGDNRVMEFNLPTNEKVIFLDKGGKNYLILPARKQYAELTKEALGFEVRRLLMPEQIVAQAKGLTGMKLVGEETQNGRQVVKYAYQAAANTNTAAGTVSTESQLIVDKETGLPLRTETVSQAQGGANVQGMNSLRLVTEMTDIKTAPDPALFELPAGYQQIDPETVKANINLIFNAVAAIVGQAMKQQGAPAANTGPTATPPR